MTATGSFEQTYTARRKSDPSEAPSFSRRSARHCPLKGGGIGLDLYVKHAQATNVPERKPSVRQEGVTYGGTSSRRARRGSTPPRRSGAGPTRAAACSIFRPTSTTVLATLHPRVSFVPALANPWPTPPRQRRSHLSTISLIFGSLRTRTSQVGEGRDRDHYDADQEGGRRYQHGGGVRPRDQDHQNAKEDEDHGGAENGFPRRWAHIVLEWHTMAELCPNGQEPRQPGAARWSALLGGRDD